MADLTELANKINSLSLEEVNDLNQEETGGFVVAPIGVVGPDLGEDLAGIAAEIVDLSSEDRNFINDHLTNIILAIKHPC